MTDDLVQQVMLGEHDDDLEALQFAIRKRREILDRTQAYTLRPGDKFRIKDVSPKYLVDALVEFIEYTDRRAAPLRVKFVQTHGRYRSGQTINLRESHVGRRVD